jgi:hypothetical protein
VRGWTGRGPGDLLGGARRRGQARRLVGGGLCSMVGAGYAAGGSVEQNQGLSSAPVGGVARPASHGGVPGLRSQGLSALSRLIRCLTDGVDQVPIGAELGASIRLQLGGAAAAIEAGGGASPLWRGRLLTRVAHAPSRKFSNQLAKAVPDCPSTEAETRCRAIGRMGSGARVGANGRASGLCGALRRQRIGSGPEGGRRARNGAAALRWVKTGRTGVHRRVSPFGWELSAGYAGGHGRVNRT